MRITIARNALASMLFLVSRGIVAQAGTPPLAQAGLPAPPPATKLEAFSPAAGRVVTMGVEPLGSLSGFGSPSSVNVEARELRDQGGEVVRGVMVEVTESQYRSERAFIDADELPELLKAMDALLDLKANPTAFKQFEVRYRTKGQLELGAYGPGFSNITRYAVRAGRTLMASDLDLSEKDFRKLRAMFDAAQQKLLSLPAKH